MVFASDSFIGIFNSIKSNISYLFVVSTRKIGGEFCFFHLLKRKLYPYSLSILRSQSTALCLEAEFALKYLLKSIALHFSSLILFHFNCSVKFSPHANELKSFYMFYCGFHYIVFAVCSCLRESRAHIDFNNNFF